MKVVKSGSADQWIRRSEKKVTSLQVNKLTRGTSRQVDQILKLKGKTMVIVDWANVWGWTKASGAQVDNKKIYEYFSKYKEVVCQYLYFGEDDHPKSKEFLKQVKLNGYKLVCKPVKYQNGVRKCNFDIEIAVDSLGMIAQIDTFVFLTGDGDFAYLYEHLIRQGKSVVVVFGRRTLGRELHSVKGLYLLDYFKLGIKNIRPAETGRPGLDLLSLKKRKKSR